MLGALGPFDQVKDRPVRADLARRPWHVWPLILGSGFRLDAFSGYLPARGYPAFTFRARKIRGITGTPEARPSRSSRTEEGFPQRLSPTPDMDRTVSRRSEPSSRAAFMGEQPNPWDVLPPQDATSRHRGAKPPRRYGLLGEISLLSLE